VTAQQLRMHYQCILIIHTFPYCNTSWKWHAAPPGVHTPQVGNPALIFCIEWQLTAPAIQIQPTVIQILVTEILVTEMSDCLDIYNNVSNLIMSLNHNNPHKPLGLRRGRCLTRYFL